MSTLVYKIYSLARLLYLKKIPFLPKLLMYSIRFVFGCYLPYTAQIGKKTVIGYGGIGIVIHKRAIIGENCVINAGVTIGGTSHKYEVPIIGDNVLIGTGAKIIGPVHVGNNVVIGANAVVSKDVPSNCVIVGNPGKIIKTDIDISNYK
ncbi:DapH/DapD/GlmU-related protein [Metabacillus dongyingensis]|uniref:serine O-acetyltransferase n=1 Tax=Metabacillus dongyingensis TaxID=2874282 RepID=UPI003B8C03ED